MTENKRTRSAFNAPFSADCSVRRGQSIADIADVAKSPGLSSKRLDNRIKVQEAAGNGTKLSADISAVTKTGNCVLILPLINDQQGLALSRASTSITQIDNENIIMDFWNLEIINAWLI